MQLFERRFNLIASSMTILAFFISLLILPTEYRYLGYLICSVLISVAIFFTGYFLGKRKKKFSIIEYTEKSFIDNLICYFEMKKKENANEEIESTYNNEE